MAMKNPEQIERHEGGDVHYAPCHGPGCPCYLDGVAAGKAGREDEYYPFGKLDTDDPIDQAIVNAFNKGTKKRED